ncbi:hypothetical protein [Oribacterium sp. KHPX15]|uniref:hypothetical protein n=1 Tax=Oribacterium sp. KHPX15 TaxID=1855342 RepID=UPI001A9A2ED8|nr:hypothetical protein [Oribacterium sp. KHPX15]
MGEQPLHGREREKKLRKTERELTTPLFLLRCMEVGISLPDLDLLTIGLVMGIWTEKENDGTDYVYTASQEDFDAF